MLSIQCINKLQLALKEEHKLNNENEFQLLDPC